MPAYECVLCNFTTKLKTDFRRHLKTKKHEKKLNESMTLKETIDEKNLLAAQFCSKNLKNAEKNLNSAQFCSKNLKNDEKNLNSAQFCSKNLKKSEKNLQDSEKNLQTSQFSPENMDFVQFYSNLTQQNEKEKTYFFEINNSNNDSEQEEYSLEMYKCNFCDYTTNRNSNFKRHINSCKSRKNEESKYKLLYEQNESEKKNLIEQHQKEKEMLYKHIDKLLEKVGHTTNNIQNNIILNNFGKEDLSHINNDFKTYLLKGPWTMIPRMIEKVHFDDKKPENKNILLPNKKEPYVKVFENATWKFRDRKETVKDLVDANYNRLDEFYEKDGDNVLNDDQQARYKNFQEKYDNYDPGILERVNKESELVLLNQQKKH
jgi:hypothetical protein